MMGSANRPTPKAIGQTLGDPPTDRSEGARFGQGAERPDHDEQRESRGRGCGVPRRWGPPPPRREPSSLPAFSCVVLVPQPSNLPNDSFVFCANPPRLNRCHLLPTTPRSSSPRASIPTRASVSSCPRPRSVPRSTRSFSQVRPPSCAACPGNDVMVQLTNAAGKLVRRRYSVHAVDEDRDQFTLWITTAHEGPGSIWARNAQPGDEVDIVGPRGKIVVDPEADWHLFMGDITCLGSAYRMAQSVEAPGQRRLHRRDRPRRRRADDDVRGRHRRHRASSSTAMGRAKDDPAGLLERPGGLRLPARARPRLSLR